jgi:DHA1 family bicyclomycin/chloramphenicol resistance-like MFS transporter
MTTRVHAQASVGGLLIATVVAQLAYGLLAMTICLPSMQAWGHIFGASQAGVQLTFSGFIVAYGGMQLLYGPLSDRLGRKRVMLFGMAVATLGSWMAAVAPGLAWLVAARVLQGAGSAAGIVVGRALVQDLFEGHQRTRAMAFVGMALGLCPPLATVLGGWLHVHLGWQAGFVGMGLLGLVLLVLAWRALPDVRVPVAPGMPSHWLRAMWRSYARLLVEPGFVPAVLLLSMTTVTFYVFLGGVPIVLGHYGVGPDGLGYFVMFVPIAYFVGNYLATRLAHRLGDRRMMRLGQSATVCGIAVMLLLALAGLRNPLAVAMPLTLLGLGHGLLVPPALAATVGLVPAMAGAAAAVAGVAQQLFGAVGGMAVGLVPHEQGAANLAWLMLGASLLGVLAQWWLHRRPAGAAGAP